MIGKEVQLLAIFENHLPDNAIALCMDLWRQHPFKFTLKKKRESILGDYRYIPSLKAHAITINDDLNKYAFLVTLLHEIAHQRTHILHGARVKPHGTEWKNEFKEILKPFMSARIFPISILIPLGHYLSNPKATSCTDIVLHKALRNFDPASKSIYLSEAAHGDTFRFNKRLFVKESTKRSRALCVEVKTGRRYFIPEAALIEQVGQTNLF
jgi:hypothetical protein